MDETRLLLLSERAAVVLFPIGVPALRVGCLLTIVAIAAIAVLYCLAREIGASSWSAATAAAAFGANPCLWNPASRHEVGNLRLLLVTLLVLASLRYRRTGRLPDMTAMALVGSLGLSDLITIALIGPALLFLCGRRLWSGPGRGPRLALLGALLLVGPALSLLLLIGRHAEPLQSLGRPVTAPLPGHPLFASGFLLPPSIHAAPALVHRLCRVGTLFLESFPYFTFTLPLLGAGFLWLQRRSLAVRLLLAALAMAGCAICAPIDGANHLLGLWMIAAALMAVALDRLRALICGPRQGATFAVVISIALVAVSLRRTWIACDRDHAPRACMTEAAIPFCGEGEREEAK